MSESPTSLSIDQGTTSTRAHDLRPLGRGRGRRPGRARADLPARPAGSSTTPSRSGRTPARSSAARSRKANLEQQEHRGGRHHQPARDRGGVGQEHRRAGVQRDRLAGHPHPEDRRQAGRWTRAWSGTRRSLRPPPGDVLLRSEGHVDPRERRRSAREGRGRRPAVRQHRHVGPVEPHRRCGARGRARHRRDQRQPHHAHGPGGPRLGRVHRLGHGHPDVDAARDQVLLRGLRRVQARRPQRRAHRRHPRRPAGRHLRPGLPGEGNREEHLRHRQLHAAQHRHRDGAQ